MTVDWLRRICNNRLAEWLTPWALFFALLSWGWRVKDLFHAVPGYGDVLEVVWAIEWFGKSILSNRSPLVFPLISHPNGYQVATFAHPLALFVATVPLYQFGGAAFAYNTVTLLSFFVAFAGMYRLARKLSGSAFSATVAALLFTFWGFRWLRINGHLHVLLGSSLLPWMIWCLERASKAVRRRTLWFVVTGVLWGLAISSGFYLIWIGGIVVLGWLVGRHLSGHLSWLTVMIGSLVSAATALALSAPAIVLFIRATAEAGASFFNVSAIDPWGASLNSLPAPFVYHPWLGFILQWFYHGRIDESVMANLGPASTILALVGLWWVFKDKTWRPVLILLGTGLLLALGYTLKWNGNSVQWTFLRPLDAMIWQLGHWMKPRLFDSSRPFPPFDQAVPLPGLVLTAVVPLWEGARTLARYVFIAVPSFFLLVLQGIKAFRHTSVRLVLAALVIFEVVPFPSGNVPAFPPSHPAFEWLRLNSQPQEGIIDLYAPQPYALELPIGGETLWATRYHNRATATGASSVWPAHTVLLLNWLRQHPHAFKNPDFIPFLRYYHVNYILLHMHGSNEKGILEESQQNKEVQLVNCFATPNGPSPWAYPICVMRIMPPSEPGFNVLRREGWSAPESWGVWAETTRSRAKWVATSRFETQIRIEAFPECIPNTHQSIVVKVNGQSVTTHQWQNCEPWSDDVIVPASLVQVGWNEISFDYAYAVRPVDLTNGENPDVRSLSVGFTRLQIASR